MSRNVSDTLGTSLASNRKKLRRVIQCGEPDLTNMMLSLMAKKEGKMRDLRVETKSYLTCFDG